MYCPTCGNEINVELKYCNRCGANLTLPTFAPMVIAPVKLTFPSIVLGVTILGGLGIIMGSATEFARRGDTHPAFIVWMVLFSAATLFGCVGLLIRFLTKMMTFGREIAPPQQQPRPAFTDRPTTPHLPPARMEPVPSVTEHTTRTFSPVYKEPADRGTR